MTKEVTQGRLDRYLRRAISVRGEKAVDALLYGGPLDMRGLGRRAHLKVLRDLMGPSRRALRRASARSPYRKLRMWIDETPAQINADLAKMVEGLRP